MAGDLTQALQSSVVAERRDAAGQVAWTPYRASLVLTGGAGAVGAIPLIGSSGKLDTSLLPSGGGGSTVSVNGVTVASPDFDATVAPPAGTLNIIWQSDVSGNVSAYVKQVSNTNAGILPPLIGTAGKIPIDQGNGTAAWADPFVQGVYAPGTRTDIGGISSGPINPVLIGGSDYTATPALRNLKIDSSGQLYIGGGTLTANIGTTNGLALDATLSAPHGSVTGGTAGTASVLVAGVYYTATPTLTNGQQISLQTDVNGNLLINGSVVASQAGTWTTRMADGAGNTLTSTTSALDVNIKSSGVTLTVSGSGTFTTQDASDGPVAPGAAATLSSLAGAVFNSVQPTLTTGQQAALQCDANGNLRMTGTVAATQSGTWTVRLDDSVGNGLTSTAGALDVNLKTSAATVTVSGTTRPAAPTTGLWTVAAISFSTSGAATIVAGVLNQTIRVMRMFIVNANATTDTNITFQDSTPTSFSGAFPLVHNGGSWSGESEGEPLFITASGKGFVINSSAAVQVSGTIWYTIS